MSHVQTGPHPAFLTSVEGARTSSGREPITIEMRLAHRLASHMMSKPCVLRPVGPRVSFSFDDVPDSAVGVGAPLLEAFGVRGTFFVSSGLLGGRTSDWRLAGPEGVGRLAAAGHEVALHTHGHRPLASLSRRAFAEDFRRCREALERLAPGRRSSNFAYPFGFAHFGHNRCLLGGARSSRTTHPGFNRGRVDLHFLKSWAFGTSLNAPAAVDRLLDEAAATGSWLIFTGHDVTDRPSPYGCTPALLAHALRGAAARHLPVEPIDAALDRLGVEPLSPLKGGAGR